METDWKTLLKDEVETLRQTRDELRVQIHLGAAEVHDTWETVEKNWGHLEARLNRLGKVAQESKKDIEEAAKLLVEEIRAGYLHIRDFL